VRLNTNEEQHWIKQKLIEVKKKTDEPEITFDLLTSQYSQKVENDLPSAGRVAAAFFI